MIELDIKKITYNPSNNRITLTLSRTPPQPPPELNGMWVPQNFAAEVDITVTVSSIRDNDLSVNPKAWYVGEDGGTYEIEYINEAWNYPGVKVDGR